MVATSSPAGNSKPAPAIASWITVPRPATAAAAERFLFWLAVEIGSSLAPQVAWTIDHPDGVPSLWGLYRDRSEPLRAALREGWTQFAVHTPRAAQARAMTVTDHLAEPEQAEWFPRFLAAAPWHDPATAELDGPAYAELFHRRSRERRRRRLVRRRRGGRPPRPSQRASATASPPSETTTLLAAIYTGARKSELTALRWRDVDFEGGKISLVPSKVGNFDSIDLHPALRKELLRLRNRGKRPPGDEHVFLSWHGTPCCDVRKVWNLALAAAEISAGEGLTFHPLRHSFATHFLEGGGSTTDLMAQLGHSKLETTQIYASALSERRRATVMGLDFAAPVSAKGSTNPRASPRCAKAS